MDPITIGLLGTSAIGSILGAGAQSSANEQNNYINMMNYYQRKQEREDSIRLAEQARKDQLKIADEAKQRNQEGTTDAMGNRMRYVPGRGWVTDLSAKGQELQDASTGLQLGNAKERLTQLMQDAPRARDVAQRNYGRQLDEGNTADSIRDQIQQLQRRDPNDVRNEMFSQRSRGVNEGYNKNLNDVARKMTRTNSSGFADFEAKAGRERAKALGEAYVDSDLQAKDYVEKDYNSKRGELEKLYAMYRGLSSTAPDAGKNNVSIDSPTTGLGKDNSLNTTANQGSDKLSFAAAGADDVLKAMMARTGNVDYVKPDTSFANALGSISSMGLGANNSYQARNQLAELIAAQGRNPVDVGSATSWTRSNSGAF